MSNDVPSPPLNRIVAALLWTATVKTCVKRVESTLEAWSGPRRGIQHERSNESRRTIPIAFEDRGSKRHILSEGHAKVVYLMKLRVCTGENRGVRSRGQRNLRIGARKDYRLAGKCIEVRSQFLTGSEEAH